MIMIFAGGHISGGHYNPAVTLGVLTRGRLKGIDAIAYMISQVIGAVVAAGVVGYLKAGIDVTPMAPDVGRALVAEFLFTFALVYVVLNTATAKGTLDNSFYGLAIGFTVMTGAFAVGGISGGAFNPAVAIGITIMNLSTWGHLWIFLVANFGGGLAAGWTFKCLNPTDV